MNKWDDRFLCLAEHVSWWSKDPSTKVGAVLAKGKRVVSLGYNGFPSAIDDCSELLNTREEKLKRVVHAEMNAILNARESVEGCTLYTTLFPCDRCAAHIIQAGIHSVVSPPVVREYSALAKALFLEAGVKVLEVHSYME